MKFLPLVALNTVSAEEGVFVKNLLSLSLSLSLFFQIYLAVDERYQKQQIFKFFSLLKKLTTV